MSKVRQRVPGDSLGMGTAAPNSHPAPSAEPRPNLDLLSVGTCICCVCCTSLTSYKQQPSAAVISARLQNSSADHIIKSMNELQKYQRTNKLCCLLPRRCPSFALRVLARAPRLPAPPCTQRRQSWGARPGPPPAHSPCFGCSVCAAPCAPPALCSLPLHLQRARLFLQPTSNRFCPSAAMWALKASRGRCFCDL